MRHFTRTAIASALLTLSAGAQAQLAVDDEVTYAFFANCADCTLNSGSSQPAALLTLVGYTPSTDLTLEHFVSFEYVGSDLVSRFIVGTVDLPNVDPEVYSHSYQIDVWNEVRGTTVRALRVPHRVRRRSPVPVRRRRQLVRLRDQRRRPVVLRRHLLPLHERRLRQRRGQPVERADGAGTRAFHDRSRRPRSHGARRPADAPRLIAAP